MSVSTCSAHIEDSVLERNGEISSTYEQDSHAMKVKGYVTDKFELMNTQTHSENFSKTFNSSEGFVYPYVSHDVEKCTFRTTPQSAQGLNKSEQQAPSLLSRCPDVSNRSKWVATAVIIVTLFALAMYARFGGGFGMNATSANAFAGAAGGALGLYTLAASCSTKESILSSFRKEESEEGFEEI